MANKYISQIAYNSQTLLLKDSEARSVMVTISEKGSPNGVATLNSNGVIPNIQLPSSVEDVVMCYPLSGTTELSSGWLSRTQSGTAITPETDKIYVLVADSQTHGANSLFRWNGSSYVKILEGNELAITTSEIDVVTTDQ